MTRRTVHACALSATEKSRSGRRLAAGARQLAAERQPVGAHAIAHLDVRHAFDERRELFFGKVLTHPPDPCGDVASGYLKRDPALQLSSHGGKLFRIERALDYNNAGHSSDFTQFRMRVAILTVSTAGARGERVDTSGDAIASWAGERKHEVVARELVSDDANAIIPRLLAWCDGEQADLVLTTGGTGLSPTDVTPEATAAVIERDASGIADWLRISVVSRFPKAALSRGRAGLRHRTLIVNLPGSPTGVADALAALDPIVEHAVAVVRGEVRDHTTAR